MTVTPQLLSQVPVRSGQRLRADRHARRGARSCSSSTPTRPIKSVRRAHRGGEGEARHPDLRLVGRGWAAAHVGGDVHAADRDEDGARPVQGQRAGDHRSPRRPGRRAVQPDQLGVAAHQDRQAARPRHGERQAHRGAARRSDAGRGRRAGLQERDLDRPLRAGEDAEGRRRQARGGGGRACRRSPTSRSS